VRRAGVDRPFVKTVKYEVYSAKFISCIIVAPSVARLLSSAGSLLQNKKNCAAVAKRACWAGLLVRGRASRGPFRLLGHLGRRRPSLV